MIGELLWLMFAGVLSGGKAIQNTFEKKRLTPFDEVWNYYRDRFKEEGVTGFVNSKEELPIRMRIADELKLSVFDNSPEYIARVAKECRKHGFLSTKEYDHYAKNMKMALDYHVPLCALRDFDPCRKNN